MNNVTRDLHVAGQKKSSKVGIIAFVLSIVMFVIAAGAPEASGGAIR
jgi:hypothetical protein